MRIGEVAAKAGVSVQTVRYYERRGLLEQAVRTRAGYRDYAEADLSRLRFILRTKGLGFTLSEVRELLELGVAPGRSAERVRQRARQKVAETEAKIRELERIRAALRHLVDACEAHGPREACTLMHAIGATEEHRRRNMSWPE
jgi:MerR family copper efflux transcriptional regulator